MRHLAIVMVLLTCGLPVTASGAPVCDKREKFVQTLRKLYAEDVSSIGVTADGKLIELLVSEAGTWTMLLTTPSGRSCAITAGKQWRRANHDPSAARFRQF